MDEFALDYTTQEKVDVDIKEASKIILSNDAFAVGDMISKLINKIEHARLSLLRK